MGRVSDNVYSRHGSVGEAVEAAGTMFRQPNDKGRVDLQKSLELSFKKMKFEEPECKARGTRWEVFAGKRI